MSDDFVRVRAKAFRNQRGITLSDRQLTSLLDGKSVSSKKFRKEVEDNGCVGDCYSGKLTLSYDGRLKFSFN